MNLNTMTERYQVHLCEDCFFRTLAYFKQKRGVQNLFSEECDTEVKASERGMIATTSHHGSSINWKQQASMDGLISLAGLTPVLDESDHQRLQELTAEQPYQTRSLQASFKEETGKNVSMVALRRALNKMSLDSSLSDTHCTA